MNLFNIVPTNYFSILNGKNKSIYLNSLSILYKLLEHDESIIKKVDFLNALKLKENDIKALDLDEEDLNEDDKERFLKDSTNGLRASFILKRLEECGWIDVSLDIDNYEEVIVLPPYTIQILKTFDDILKDDEAPYISLVHSTYSELKLEDEDMDELLYATLLRSYENTKKLKVELVTLTHSIRIFQNRLSKLFDTNEVLYSYFDVYKRKISDRYYHPLKTFDSVAKFKRPIVKILNRWLDDKEIREKLILQASISSRSNDKKKIESDIIEKINYITDTYETLNTLISKIDKENNQYTKSSTDKILYLNNADHTVKGNLENVFKYYANNINNPKKLIKVLSLMQDSFSFIEQGYFDSSSITLPIIKEKREEGLPLEIRSIDDIPFDNTFLDEEATKFSEENIYQFMEKEFGVYDELSSDRLMLDTSDSLIYLILATIKSDDEQSFYTLDEIVKGKEVINNYFSIPNMTFRRKKEDK